MTSIVIMLLIFVIIVFLWTKTHERFDDHGNIVLYIDVCGHQCRHFVRNTWNKFKKDFESCKKCPGTVDIVDLHTMVYENQTAAHINILKNKIRKRFNDKNLQFPCVLAVYKKQGKEKIYMKLTENSINSSHLKTLMDDFLKFLQ